ncbi:MAG: FAD-dependent oxidoreductase, partial [Bacillota bacterium]|nr:FAD-dependent oxidoreductase [Bacillota bacterium]
MKKTDAIIIGFGKGGKTLAGALAEAGKNVVMVEESEEMYGGTCINAACIPTKSLVHSAGLSAVRGGSFEEKALRYAEAVEEKERLTAMLRQKNYHKLADDDRIQVILGRGSFVDSHHVAVATKNSREIWEAEHIFINTGSRPFVPPIDGLNESKRVYLSETLLKLKELPRRLIIIGGGYIGMEFASMYANFGSQVTVIQDSEAFFPREDREAAAVVLEDLQSRGVKIYPGAAVTKVADSEDKAIVSFLVGSEKKQLTADAVLVATGRRPNVAGLNLDAAGIKLTSRGAIEVDEHLRTSAPNIWAMGDVVGG